MQFELNQYKKLRQQSVNVESGLTVLVGTNGSGKSSFLEYLFLNNNFESCIVYSSGVNESFSPKYRSYLRTLYRKSLKIVSSTDDEIEVPGGKFYFSKEWAPFLILASAFLSRTDSNTARWMNHFRINIASFEFQVYLPSSFKSKLKKALRNIEEGITGFRFETSQIVKFLNRLLNNEIEENLDKTKINIKWGSLDDLQVTPGSVVNADLYQHLFDSEFFTTVDNRINPVKKFFQMLQILSAGGSRTRFVPLEYTEITFNRGEQLINLRDLSDGEFQILLNSALLDLFDGENSLFLLDEVDAHIHPTMVKKVWSSFDNVSGFAFTTSHNLLTISNSDYNRIIFLEDGTIISNTAKKIKLVDDICGTLFGGPVFKSLLYSIENVILIDDHSDWEIFKALMLRSGIEFSQLESNLLVLKKESGTDRDDRNVLIKAKRDFVNEIQKVAEDNSDINPEQIKLRNIFLLCDSDAYVYRGRGLDIMSDNVTIKRKRVNIHSVVWNRRYIESYLISPMARAQYSNADAATFSWGDLDNHGTLVENVLNEVNVKRVKCKDVVRGFIGNQGFDAVRLNEYISRMSAEEIDPYMTLVFNEIVRLKALI